MNAARSLQLDSNLLHRLGIVADSDDALTNARTVQLARGFTGDLAGRIAALEASRALQVRVEVPSRTFGPAT